MKENETEIVNVERILLHPTSEMASSNRRHDPVSRNARELGLNDCGVPEDDRIRNESSQADVREPRNRGWNFTIRLL